MEIEASFACQTLAVEWSHAVPQDFCADQADHTGEIRCNDPGRRHRQSFNVSGHVQGAVRQTCDGKYVLLCRAQLKPRNICGSLQDLRCLYEKVASAGVSEDRVLNDSSLGLDDQAGLVKCWFAFDRRKQAVGLLRNEERLSGIDYRRF